MDDLRRNIYKRDVDFAALALKDEEFAKYLKPNGQLDFTDPDAVRQLTKSLLRRDFEIEVDLPDDRLCPPLPNRLNYILWIQDLIDCTTGDYRPIYDSDRKVAGIDVGTGASCIYPFLACAQRPNWTFAATDIDDKNVQYAKRNVQKNKLDNRIKVVQTVENDPLIPIGDRIALDELEFTMCNPPFYESQEEMIESAKVKARPPFSACTGAVVEMVTPGGEVAFVTRMIDESLMLRKKVRWYTSMLGKLSSVMILLEKLQKVGNQNYAVTEFVQGSKTKRWAIAWSWRDLRPTMATGRNISNVPKHLLPFPPEFTFHPSFESTSALAQAVRSTISSLDIHWQWDSAISSGVGFAMENVWSRQARRKRARADESGSAAPGALHPRSSMEAEAALGFTVRVRQRDVERMDVIVRWVKGLDHVLFESFCGMLKREVQG